MKWVDAWWFTLWAAIFSLLVASWVQAQEAEGGIFADGFETGDTSCWPNGCEPEPVSLGLCDEGEEIVRKSEPNGCESFDTPHGTAWLETFGVVCRDESGKETVRLRGHWTGLEKPRNCEEEE